LGILIIHIPAAIPKLAKKRRGFSLTSGLFEKPFAQN
jgi:hypothetical protein